MKTFKEWLDIKEASRWKNTKWKRPPVDTLLRLKKYNRTGYYCHFSDIPNKIGINPQSVHLEITPHGIYAYTVKYAVQNSIIRLPFASDKKYIWVFRAKNPRKIKKINSRKDEIALLWNELLKINKKRTEKENIMRMTNFFLRQGVEGIVDNGTGTISIGEPHQAVFFGSQTITPVDFFENKLTKDSDHLLYGDNEKEEEEEERDSEDDEHYFGNLEPEDFD